MAKDPELQYLVNNSFLGRVAESRKGVARIEGWQKPRLVYFHYSGVMMEMKSACNCERCSDRASFIEKKVEELGSKNIIAFKWSPFSLFGRPLLIVGGVGGLSSRKPRKKSEKTEEQGVVEKAQEKLSEVLGAKVTITLI